MNDNGFCDQKCADKHRVKKRQHRIKALAVEAKGGKCCICGYNQSLAALEFHHVNRSTKLFSISTALSKAWPIIRHELTKCVLLCANCHRAIENGDLTYNFTKKDLDLITINEDSKYPTSVECEMSIEQLKASSKKNGSHNKARLKSKDKTKQVKAILSRHYDEKIIELIKKHIMSTSLRTLAKILRISRETLKSICRQNNIEFKKNDTKKL